MDNELELTGVPKRWNHEKWASRELVEGVVRKRPGCTRRDIQAVALKLGHPHNQWAVQWPLVVLRKEGVIKKVGGGYYMADFEVKEAEARVVDPEKLAAGIDEVVPNRLPQGTLPGPAEVAAMIGPKGDQDLQGWFLAALVLIENLKPGTPPRLASVLSVLALACGGAVPEGLDVLLEQLCVDRVIAIDRENPTGHRIRTLV